MARKKKEYDFETDRSRNWVLLLFTDNEEHMRVFDYVTKSEEFETCYALHEHDEYEEDDETRGIKAGDRKKPHYHLYFRLKKKDEKQAPNARYTKSICKEIGLTIDTNEKGKKYCRWIQNVDSEKYIMRYMIHIDQPNKYQYNVDIINGSLANKAKMYCLENDKGDEEKVSEIMNLIRESDEINDLLEFGQKCLELGCWSEFRRAFVFWDKAITQHNKMIRKQKHDERYKKNYVSYIDTSCGRFDTFSSIKEYLQKNDIHSIHVFYWQQDEKKWNINENMNAEDIEALQLE